MLRLHLKANASSLEERAEQLGAGDTLMRPAATVHGVRI